MFFRKARENAPTVEEELEILSNRLEGSVYYEDKISTLNAILQESEVHPFAVGTYALKNVIHSMEEMEEVATQLAILKNVFACSHKLEFADITVNDLDNLRILCDCIKLQKNEKEAYDLLCKLSISELFSSQVLKITNIACYCTQMVRKGKTDLLPILIKEDLNFKKQIVFEGVFENILYTLERSYSKDVMCVLSTLLRDCSFNQNYFNELNWKSILKHLPEHPEEIFGVLTALVDLKNVEVQKLQNSVYKTTGLETAFRHKQWYLIYLMLKDNNAYTTEFVENILDFDDVAKNFNRYTYRKQNEACVLIDYLLHGNVNIPELNSYKIYAIQSLREQKIPVDILMKRSFEEIQSFDNARESAVFDALVFVIFNFDVSLSEKMVPVFINMFNDYTKPELHRNLCLISLLMFETPIESISINIYEIDYSLRKTRKILCNIDLNSEFYLIDEMIDMLLDNISALINKYTVPGK